VNNKTIMTWIVGLWTLFGIGAAAADEVRSGLNDQTDIAVTIYNENLALVRDQRSISMPVGVHDLAIRDVSGQIRPETALLGSSGGSASMHLLEQNFDFDLLSPESLLQKFIGKEIRAVSINPATGNETIETATVLATNQGLVLQFADRIETGFPGRLIFDRVPDNLRDRPTLVLKVDNKDASPQTIRLTYLTGGISWKADYVASLNEDETSLDLNGWVTLTNQSGTSYPQALLQLVAGEVQQVQEAMLQNRGLDMMMAAAPAKEAMSEESLFDYHLYTLERPTTIANQQTKQVALMDASSVPVNKRYIVEGQGQLFGGRYSGKQSNDVGVFIELVNDAESSLGVPLPAGIMRVYKNDSAGRAQFIGEDRIDHTPRGEEIKLKLGNAFDVTAESVQTGFTKVQSVGQYNFSAEVSQRITLKNAKDIPVQVTLREYIPGDWKILSEPAPHHKTSSNTVEWKINVPADAGVTHEYTALVRY